jgi:hypothetical protein
VILACPDVLRHWTLLENQADWAEFFPDEDEEETDSAAPAVDASGQYAFQSDGESGAVSPDLGI